MNIILFIVYVNVDGVESILITFGLDDHVRKIVAITLQYLNYIMCFVIISEFICQGVKFGFSGSAGYRTFDLM